MSSSDTPRFEKALAASATQHYVLRLYVIGATAASQRAIANLTRLCEEELQGRYTLEVIDVYQSPELLAGEQIIATPTLIRYLPAPVARLVGDMSDRERVLLGLDLRPVADDATARQAEA